MEFRSNSADATSFRLEARTRSSGSPLVVASVRTFCISATTGRASASAGYGRDCEGHAGFPVRFAQAEIDGQRLALNHQIVQLGSWLARTSLKICDAAKSGLSVPGIRKATNTS